ncbi:YifB family Mg chelatase-like AAA ATPase [Salmonella enterica]|nr:ATP-dependent protease [Salmonella enterica]EDL1778696.1 hypothetical protein [Salmonella enterica subsp. enterica serovar Poona]EBN4454446.1 ATP-dependent protease [Salmonella enterica]EEL6361956.1 YifB family Mg chelatase-like AAA ATPase [Salmonella enterica]EEN5911804.1 YifB family Mg chelatase-like AAA ATPase [Salmonella enterica]
MSLAIVHTRAALGVNAPPITIEVHISNGLPGLTMVGLPETTVKEARDRVRSAIINSGYEFPAKKITINLAPADLPKEGGRYDLPIAVALLAASEQLTASNLEAYELVGELALTGALRGVPGAISSATEAIKAGRNIIVATENAAEVGLISKEGCFIADHLQTVCAFLEGKHALERPLAQDMASPTATADLRDVIGQEQGKRGLEITAAGGHNLLLIGPPGTGKTMLASRLSGILPPLSNEEALESAAILSLVNADTVQKRWQQRPFRSPHHSASLTAMVGGGAIPAPGEISLAHNGILFLDEFSKGESSATVKKRVIAAHERQYRRQKKLNARLEGREIQKYCVLHHDDARWLEDTLVHLGLSIRAWQRLLKVARTIADIELADQISRQHLQEAVSYRAIDRLLIHLQKLLA